MSLASQITSLADRLATEFNAVRGEFASLISGFQTTDEKGAANGYASLDASALLDIDQMPDHAGTHATAGSDPVSPASIGAATASHVHQSAYNLAYAATLSADYNNGTHQYTTLTGDAILGVPSNIPAGAALQYTLYATTAPRTVTIDSGIARVGALPSSFVIPTGTLIRLTVENNPRAGAAGVAGPLLTAEGPYQPLDADLSAFAALSPSTGQSIAWNGSAWVAGAPTGVAWSDRVEALADSATLSPNALSGLIQCGVCTTLGQAATLNAPSNGSQGQSYVAIVKATSADRVITFASFTATSDWSTAAYTITNGKWGIFTFRYISAIGWVIAGKMQTA